MGQLLSILHIIFEYAVNAVLFWRRSELQCLIEDVGLDEVKWTKILREVLGVNAILQLKAIAENHEEIRKVFARADDYEISGLHELFDIPQDEEQSISEPENNVCVRLKELGLDERHWFRILKTKFAVSSMDSIKHIGLDSLNDLKHVCQTRNEMEKLQNFFGIDNEYPSFVLHFVKVQNRIKLVIECIRQIKSLLSNGKTRSCKSVHAKEQSLREILQITPANWIRPTTSLEKVLNDFSKLSCYLEAPIPTQGLLPSHLIQSSSGGVCLKGVLYTGNGNYVSSANYPVLKSPSKVRLNGSNLSKTEVVITGDNDHVKSFIEHADTYECVSEYLNLPSSNGNESAVKMKKVPIASFTFRRDELRFSDSALEYLKIIGTMADVDETRVMECCKEFLNTYGSHIFQGPFHFGGIHWITARGTQVPVVVRGDVDIQAINLESIAAFSNAPLGRFGLNSEYDANKEKGKIRLEYRSHGSKCAVVKATTSGGHNTFSYLPTWKLGMSADISSWNVIGRGTAFTVAIWEILNENYSSQIENASTISYYLFKAWVDMSNVHHIFNISSELQDLINEARTYVTSLEDIDVTDRQYSILENLLKIKENVIKHTRSITAWSDIFLGSKDFNIVNFLKRLMNSPKHDTLTMISKIINDNDILNQPCVSNDKLNEYHNWLHILETKKGAKNERNNEDISEFSDFTLILEQAVMDLEVKDQSQHTSSNVAAYLSTAVIRLVDVFQRRNRLSDAKFLLALTTPLGFSETTGFLHTKLTIQDVSNLVITVKHNVSTYAELKDEQRKSIFIFSTLLELTMLTGDYYNLKQKLRKSIYDLPSEIRDKIDSLENEDPENWMKIEACLRQYFGQLNSHDHDLSLRSSLYKATHCDKETYGSRTNIPNIYGLKPQSPDIIKVLNLEQYFPKKITRQMALMVSENVISRDDLKHISNIPWYLLQSIILCNYDGLSFEPNQIYMDYSGGKKLSTLLNKTTTVKKRNSTTDIHLNPTDVLVALFMCADDFLRQLIMEKLTMCQLSIPLLLPVNVDGSQSCEMLLWATRTIKKQWKTYSGTSCERSMSLHPIPIVSAIRIGRLSKSKSKILNAVINDQKHDVFFHYGSNGGNMERTLSTGSLELTWYLPTGRNRDKFSDAVAIMNLRGNASHLKDQTTFLSKVSFATIAFITPDKFDKYESDLLQLLYQQNGYLVIVSVGPLGKDMTKLLLSLEQRYSKGDDPPKQSVLIYSSEKNELQMSGEIRSTLNYLLSKECCGVPERSIDECSGVWRNIGFYVDEDTKECLDAKADAEEMLTSLQHHTSDSGDAEEKIKLLPLQMIAIEIAERNRELCQLKQKGNMATEQYIDKVQSDLNQLRIKQKHDCSSISNLITIFMKSFSFSSLKRKYFHCWVKIMADHCSINQLQPVREEYNAKWNQLCNVVYKNQNKPTQEIESLKKILDELQQKLTNLSLGLEHFNREIGQIYEMVLHFKLPPSWYSVHRFPMVAADMLFEGHPLELMDGDASHVPMKWIKDVMSCLQQKIGNKRLFVLSVLGVQSTGKSTMLNVMFGLQFAVSAGRCTKGVFAQLVQLHPDLQQSTKCDYIMVVDTEGLRAPELASIEHTNRDNEIATLVIGLGDATIINIMGENPTDMQDTLQIVVHALMKMETVKMKPSCLFVHQNVSDITASDRNTAQKRKMTRMLDEITKIAAKEENCSEKYQVFSDVIHFQENKHVVYISSLWQGDPPMAPPNPGYSSCILKVREKVIDLMKNCDCQTIIDFHHKLTDLWKAILSENFVFSFRNTLEIQAFNSLETQYVEHSRTLRRNAMMCVNILRTECKKLTPSLLKSESETILTRHLTTLDKGIKTFEDKMNTYFINKPKARQWKGRTQLRMNELCQDLRKSLKEELMAMKKRIIGRAKIDSDIKTYEKDIRKKAKGLADEFRTKGTHNEVTEETEERLKREFDVNWVEWVSDIPDQDDPVQITLILDNIFRDSFPSHRDQMVIDILSKRTFERIVSEADIKVVTKTFRDRLPYFGCSASSCIDIARNCINSIKSDLVRMIESYKSEGKTFNEQIGRDLVEFVRNRLNDVKTTDKFMFTPKGLIRNTIHIVWSLVDKLNDLQEAFRKETDLKQYMECQKNRLWQMFRDECTIVQLSVSASYAVSRDLSSVINNSLIQNCITGVIDHVRTSRSRTFANKMSYHAQLLIDLAEKKNFQAFRMYLADPCSFMEGELKENLREFCTTTTGRETVLQSIYSQKITELFSKARAAIHDTCRSLPSACSMSVWWPNLIENIGDEFDVKPEIGFLNSDDTFEVKELNDKLLMELKKSEEEMQEEFSMDFFAELIEPCKEFFKTDLLGCLELCPFCKAPCDLQAGDKYDDHRTEYHRPKGVAGYRRVNTGKLSVTVCTSSVMTDGKFRNKDTGHEWHPYKEYQSVNKYYKAWKIQPMAGESQLYWKWFIATYNEELAEYYDCNPPDIPDGWMEISWETAKDDMINTYNL